MHRGRPNLAWQASWPQATSRASPSPWGPGLSLWRAALSVPTVGRPSFLGLHASQPDLVNKEATVF